HPDIQRLNTLIASTRGSIADAARTQLAALDLRIAALDEQQSESMATLRALPETGGEELRLIEEVEAARGTVAALTAEHNSARLAESVEISQVQVIDYARFAAPVTVGNRQRSLIIALVFG